MINFAPIRHRLFGISTDETTFDRRGFPATDPAVQQHLETAGCAFVDGYNAALAKAQAEELAPRLNDIDATYRGFAFEGAAMALALLDLVTPWNRRRLQRFIDTPAGDAHWYMLHIGAGWAIARVPWARRNFEHAMRRYHSLYGWLALDGYGFHQGFFYTHQYVVEQRVPRRLSQHAARVFDQGLGRSMWFSQGADSKRIAAAISAFPTTRQGDLWSGAGLAATYAGGVSRDTLEDLRDRAGGYADQVAQGAAFAAKARLRAGNPAAHTDMACEIFCRMSADEAAAITDECLMDLPSNGTEPAYELWRGRIRQRFIADREAISRTLDSVPSLG